MLNKVQSKLVTVTSYDIWINKEPYLSHLKVWGYATYKKRLLLDKLEAKYDKCLFIGILRRQLDIGSTTLWNKFFLFKSIQSS